MKVSLAAVLTLGWGLVAVTPVAAGSPSLASQCGAPVNGVVTCDLSGRGFRPQERLYIFYEVVTTAGSTTTARMYSRAAYTSPAGSFRRPPFRFSGDRSGRFTYRVTSIVIGSRGDQATTRSDGTP